MIYLDNSATTKTRDEVADLVCDYSKKNFFNPSSVYSPAIAVKRDILDCKKRLLKLLNASQQDNIVFTASATEANNLALLGASRKNKKILISSGEHPSVFETAKNLQNLGYMVDFITLDASGAVSISDLESKLDDSVGLVSIIHVSNETGAINDLKKIGKIIKTKSPSCLFHSDGVQAFGKIEEKLLDWGVDLYTMSSHKIHGPKGVAGLYVKSTVNLKPIIFGGGQEGGLRSGTENPAGIMGFTLASELMYENFLAKRKHIAELKAQFLDLLSKTKLDYIVNGNNTLDNIVSVSFLGIKGEVLLHSLEKYEIYVSTGSACSSKTVGNRVLSNLGLSKKQMEGNIRISFSEFNTLDEVNKLVDALKSEIKCLVGEK